MNSVGTWNRGRSNPNRGKRLPPEPLTSSECIALLGACSQRAPTGIRNGALLAVLWRAGLRVSEALALRPADLDLESGSIRVLHGKGNQCRTVGMDPQAFALVILWMERRKALGLGRREHLFCTLKGLRLNASYVRALLPRLAKRAGIEKRVHAHGLRHSMAASLRQEGVDIGVISRQLGHRSIATTARYLDHISPQTVIDTMREREW